jgi:Methyltransferase domain
MSTTNIDEGKLNAFIGQMLSDLGGASSIAMVRMGDALGLYKTIQAQGPMTSMELAKAANVDERYLREWLSHQAASNYLSYDPATAKFALPPEQAMVFANEESPVYMMGGFDVMVAMLDNQPKVQAAFKSGTGVAWGDQAGCMFCAVARFFRPAYHNNLVSAWLPALEGVVKKLEAGARVADVGCGHGWSTVLMAKAFPKSQFVGYDFHSDSIREATAHAKSHGVAANAQFAAGLAKDYAGKDFDLAYQREAPRLCRGGSRSLTFPAAIDERPRLVSHHAHEKEFRDGPVLMSLLTSEENRVVLRTYHCL